MSEYQVKGGCTPKALRSAPLRSARRFAARATRARSQARYAIARARSHALTRGYAHCSLSPRKRAPAAARFALVHAKREGTRAGDPAGLSPPGWLPPLSATPPGYAPHPAPAGLRPDPEGSARLARVGPPRLGRPSAPPGPPLRFFRDCGPAGPCAGAPATAARLAWCRVALRAPLCRWCLPPRARLPPRPPRGCPSVFRGVALCRAFGPPPLSLRVAPIRGRPLPRRGSRLPPSRRCARSARCAVARARAGGRPGTPRKVALVSALLPPRRSAPGPAGPGLSLLAARRGCGVATSALRRFWRGALPCAPSPLPPPPLGAPGERGASS